jgi:6,7-dimethyl-8-ribityllumazine synthase
MNQSDRHPATHSPAGRATRYAFVQSCWHADVVNQGRDAFLAEMARGGVPRDAIDLFEVPGAFEIPLHAKILARTGCYLAIVACGFVVDGGIYRHEFVADAVISALMQVQLETEVPVFSAVLTPQQFHEHADHLRFFTEHFVVKGTEVASACLRTLESLRRVRDIAEASEMT